MSQALRCQGLSVTHPSQQAPTLHAIHLAVSQGERVALVGLNGSGKTTLLMALAGLVPHRGTIQIDGQELTGDSVARLRRQIGVLFNVPEDQLLFPKVIEDVAFGLVQQGTGREQAYAEAQRVLDRLGVGALAQWPVAQLSHGQKQRMALAGALITAPPLLLLDEPSSGLDPPGRRELARLLAELQSAQLIATHDLDFADRVCSRVVLLAQGTIAVDGPSTAEIHARWTPKK